jgi:DNA-binding HxlR family transcriptional regulator
MRSYNQWCALAKALDLVGDRWVLLIVRELLIREACRYTDIRNGLPGIATNLLAERLRELEDAGLVAREEAPPPIAATLYRLTPRGRALEPAILELGRWGAQLLSESHKGDVFLPHWLVPPLKLHLADSRPGDPASSIEVRVGDEAISIRADRGTVDIRPGHAERPDAVVTGKPQAILNLFAGRIDPDKTKAAGLRIQGEWGAVLRVIPRAP